MNISFASEKDKLSVIRSIQRNQTDYITTQQAKDDIDNNRLIICKNDKAKVVGIISVELKEDRGYIAIRRGMVTNKLNRGKGIMSKLVDFICQQSWGYPLGATPWIDNTPMIKILERNNFVRKYTFNTVWTYYERD